MKRRSEIWGGELLFRLGWGIVLTLLLLTSPALPQAQFQTLPSAATTKGSNVSTTIISTGVFQLVWAAGGGSVAPTVGTAGQRHGCTIQNNGTNVMYVTEGLGISSSTTALATQVPAGGAYYCSAGSVVLVGEIDITGTVGDAFYAAQF